MRWVNYLRPGIKRGNISADEEDLIVRLHKLLGNRYILIYTDHISFPKTSSISLIIHTILLCSIKVVLYLS